MFAKEHIIEWIIPRYLWSKNVEIIFFNPCAQGIYFGFTEYSIYLPVEAPYSKLEGMDVLLYNLLLTGRVASIVSLAKFRLLELK